jgi:putative ABC transport system permease protein
VSARRFGLALLARRSLRQHALSTLVTALSLALSSGLALSVFAIGSQSERAFTVESTPFDAALGARGSQLQLVLNSVFHLETSPGNLPWSAYEEVRAKPGVRAAIPFAVGDNWRGFRIVGTDARMFDAELLGPKAPRVSPGGRVFDEKLREVGAGSFVAQRTGLRVGATIHPSHGLERGDDHDEEYVVVGILEPTNTPNDRCLWIPIEGMYRMGGHVLRGTGETHVAEAGRAIEDAHKEVSAVMLRFDTPQAGLELERAINREGTSATLAWPIARVVAELFDRIGWMSRILAMVAYLTVLVGAATILAGLYDSMQQRRREMAVLRALGMRRRELFATVVLEASTIAALGAIGGWAVYALVLWIARGVLRAQAGVVLDPLAFHESLVLVPAGVVALGALCGLVPAWKAYRVEVASDLSSANG